MQPTAVHSLPNIKDVIFLHFAHNGGVKDLL